MKRYLVRTAIVLIAALALMHAADFVVLKIRIATNHNPYGTVTVRSYYSIAKKNSKVEYDYIGTEDETCTHSLFPHGGYNPCWYASSHTERNIELYRGDYGNRIPGSAFCMSLKITITANSTRNTNAT